jgi:hypothetical protein
MNPGKAAGGEPEAGPSGPVAGPPEAGPPGPVAGSPEAGPGVAQTEPAAAPHGTGLDPGGLLYGTIPARAPRRRLS